MELQRCSLSMKLGSVASLCGCCLREPSLFGGLQMHWDQSVTPLPECRFPSTFAACLLASARAVLNSTPPSPGYDSTASGDSQSSPDNLSQGHEGEAPDW